MELNEDGAVIPEGTSLWSMSTLNGVGSRPMMASSEATRQTFTDSTNNMLLRANVGGVVQPLLQNPGNSYGPNQRQSVGWRSHHSGVLRKPNLGRGSNHTNEGRVDVLEAECTSLRFRNFLLQKEVERLKVEKGVRDEQMAGFRRKVVELDAMLTELRASKVPPVEFPAAPMAAPPASARLLASDYGGFPAAPMAALPAPEGLLVSDCGRGFFDRYPPLSGACTNKAQHARPLTQCVGVAPTASEVFNGPTQRNIRGEPVLRALSWSRRQVAAPCQGWSGNGIHSGPFPAGQVVPPVNVTVAQADAPPVVETLPARARLAQGTGRHEVDSLPFQMPPQSELTPAMAKAIRTRLLTGRRKPVDAPLKSTFHRVPAVGNAASTLEPDKVCVVEPPSASAVADDTPVRGRGVELVGLDRLSRGHPLEDFWDDSARSFSIAQGTGVDLVERARAVGTSSRCLQQSARSAPPVPSEQPVEVPHRPSSAPESRDVAPTAPEDMVTECIEVPLHSSPPTEGAIAASLPSQKELVPSLSIADAMADKGSPDCSISSGVNATSRREFKRKHGGSSGGTDSTSLKLRCSRTAAVARMENRPRLRVSQVGTHRRASTPSSETPAVTATIKAEPTLHTDAESAAPVAGAANETTLAVVRATPLLRRAGVDDEDAEGRHTHITVCAYCCNATVDDAAIGLCEGCPRVFCIPCLREGMQKEDPIAPDVDILSENAGDVCVKQCAWCVRGGDVDFPPPPADLTPMDHLLEQLLAHDLSRQFRSPVDIDEHPDYIESIGRESMMDLGRMLKKLRGRKYPRRRGPGQFIEDLARIWRNCRKFAGCDELGRPHYGTAVPGIVRCALILEAMATKYCTTHISEHEGTDWPETAWDFYRKKTQRENEEARLGRLERRESAEGMVAPPASGATEGPPIQLERPVGGAWETSRSVPNMGSSRERLPTKRSRTAMQRVVAEADENGLGGEHEDQPRGGLGAGGSGVVVGNLGRGGAQPPTLLPRAEGNTSTEELVKAATAGVSSEVRDKESSLLTSQPDCSILDRLCDVVAAFPEPRTS